MPRRRSLRKNKTPALLKVRSRADSLTVAVRLALRISSRAARVSRRIFIGFGGLKAHGNSTENPLPYGRDSLARRDFATSRDREGSDSHPASNSVTDVYSSIIRWRDFASAAMRSTGSVFEART